MGVEVAPPCHSSGARVGLDLAWVISDAKHYSPLVCSICNGLVSLDAVVTSRCSHPFCRKCLEEWVAGQQLPTATVEEDTDSSSSASSRRSSCPCCKDDISPSELPAEACMELGSRSIGARPLQQAQPLAYQVLKLIQVKCKREGSSGKEECRWKGNYEDLPFHTLEHDKRSDDGVVVSEATSSDIENNNSYLLPRTSRLSSDEPKKDEIPETPKRLESSAADLALAQKSLLGQACTTPRGSKEGSPTERTTTRETLFPRKESNRSLQASPTIPLFPQNKGVQQRSPNRDAPPNKIARKVSGASGASRVSFAGSSSKAGSSSIEETFGDGDYYSDNEPSRNPSSLASPQQSTQSSSQSTLMEWQHASVNSVSLWEDSDMESNAMTAIEEKDDIDDSDDEDETMVALHLDPEDEETITSPDVKSRQIRERAEKLKKQANAKFNKGDFAAARVLYTEGITVMSAFNHLSDHERMLLSNMHSNRAVTYFRDKDFVSCIVDCDKAIAFDPTFDKSWVRKWRALVALGQFEEAHLFIDDAARLMPDSTRIQDEYKRSFHDYRVLTEAKRCIENDNLEEARQVFYKVVRESTNVRLICLAAIVDTRLGQAESALELAVRALQLNPKYAEALEINGTSLFLMGDTEQGAHVLYNAYVLDGDCPKIKAALTRCQKTHSAASQARSSIKRGMYEEATRTFTTAINESGPISPQSPLYTMLRVERAEAWLLSTKYLEALKDCQEIFNVNIEHPGAWVIRSEVLIALGKAEDAKLELSEIRQGWGANDPAIEEGYRRVDFELRVEKADEELLQFVSELESGNCERINGVQQKRRPNAETRDGERSFRNEGQESQTRDKRSYDKQRSASYRSHDSHTKSSRSFHHDESYKYQRRSNRDFDSSFDSADSHCQSSPGKSRRQRGPEDYPRDKRSHHGRGTRRKRGERRSDDKSRSSSTQKSMSKSRLPLHDEISARDRRGGQRERKSQSTRYLESEKLSSSKGGKYSPEGSVGTRHRARDGHPEM